MGCKAMLWKEPPPSFWLSKFLPTACQTWNHHLSNGAGPRTTDDEPQTQENALAHSYYRVMAGQGDITLGYLTPIRPSWMSTTPCRRFRATIIDYDRQPHTPVSVRVRARHGRARRHFSPHLPIPPWPRDPMPRILMEPNLNSVLLLIKLFSCGLLPSPMNPTYFLTKLPLQTVEQQDLLRLRT
jgi:hypothetical protein